MALLNILRYPDPRLHKVAAPIAQVDDRIRTLAADMLETMYAAEGVGLAATQVDVHERLIVMDTSEGHDQPLVLINPELIAVSDEMMLGDEGWPDGPHHLRQGRAACPGDGQSPGSQRQALPVRGRRPSLGLRTARDGPPARQGVLSNT